VVKVRKKMNKSHFDSHLLKTKPWAQATPERIEELPGAKGHPQRSHAYVGRNRSAGMRSSHPSNSMAHLSGTFAMYSSSFT
jgi:hypothetical protein